MKQLFLVEVRLQASLLLLLLSFVSIVINNQTVANNVTIETRKSKIPTQRIIGGETVSKDQFKFNVRLLWAENKESHCSGSIIDKRHVLTSAHCVSFCTPNGKWDAQFDLGSLYMISSGNDREDEFDGFPNFMEAVFVHHLYREDVNGGLSNDIAIIKTYSELPIGDDGWMLYLPNSKSRQIGFNENLFTVGWGSTGFTDNNSTEMPARYLQSLRMRLFNDYRCWAIASHPANLCAENYDYLAKATTCTGDAGAPLFRRTSQKNRYEIVGLLSYMTGQHCTGTPVYTDIRPYTRWILDILKKTWGDNK